MKRGGRKIWLTALLIIGIVACVVAIVVPSLQRMREPDGIVPCASHMRQIGQALLLYSQDHGGRYPQRLEELVGPDSLPRECLVCAVSEKPSIFTAAGAMEDGLGVDDVIVYEPLAAHDDEGSYVLFGDGHVAWLTPGELKNALARATTRATNAATTRDGN